MSVLASFGKCNTENVEGVIKTNTDTNLTKLKRVETEAKKYPGTETLCAAALKIFGIQLCLPQ